MLVQKKAKHKILNNTEQKISFLDLNLFDGREAVYSFTTDKKPGVSVS